MRLTPCQDCLLYPICLNKFMSAVIRPDAIKLLMWECDHLNRHMYNQLYKRLGKNYIFDFDSIELVNVKDIRVVILETPFQKYVRMTFLASEKTGVLSEEQSM